MAFNKAEIGYLATHRSLIDEHTTGLELSKKSMLHDQKILRDTFGDFARSVTELVVARRSATGKFPSHWLTDSDAAQQATPNEVSSYRASLLADAGATMVHDVTCSIGTEAPAVLEEGMRWLGSDLDESRLAMARANLGPRAWLARADALAPTSREGVIVADPARRVGGRRITDPAQLMPPLPDLLEAYPQRELAVKCAPGIDYSDWDGLVSVVSVDGAVKEACLYTSGLGRGHRREAVLLGKHRETVTDADEQEVPVHRPGRYIIEPDGAIVRAGLVRGWAAKHQLWMLDAHIAYVTGDALPPGTSGFPFIEMVPMKKLKQALHAHGAGAIEILVRGVDVDPDQLRKKLKLKGNRSMGVVIARIGDGAVAYVCEAREHSDQLSA
ncbi:SAM-dependent methyltransferase [Corynebacterium breve]|uniref:SAM-dependent methyltransferase n=1 Tax=Corynebacterium breve TaxID=3049799 RepID=A0ABY8VHU1_9CORY|nr:SAM-dependent methyltransferase [Corynebacterium breve]WIM68647.1 SAM-dependent methyltransferase [Corynebacterium breve]